MRYALTTLGNMENLIRERGQYCINATTIKFKVVAYAYDMSNLKERIE